MRFPSFRSRQNIEGSSTSNERIFAEAVELAQLRLEQCIADLHDRIRTSKQALDRGVQSPSAEIQEPAA